MSVPPHWRLTANVPCWKFRTEPWTTFLAASTHAHAPERRRLLDNSTSCLFGVTGEQLLPEPARATGDFPLRVLAALLKKRSTEATGAPHIQGPR